MMSTDEITAARDQLAAVLALVESGDLPTERDQVDQLRGAVAVLTLLAEPVSIRSE